MLVTAYHWLVANGLWRDLESAAILVPIMRLMAMKPLQKLEKLIAEIRLEAEEKIDLVKTIRKVNEKPQDKPFIHG